MTAQDVIYRSMRLAGITPKSGRTPGADDLADGLAALNAMLDAWSVERLTVYCISRDVYNLDLASEGYTIGPGGHWNTARPVRIENAGLILLTNPSQPLELPLDMPNKEQYAAIRLKGLQSTFPRAMYNDNAFPLATLHFWPVPTDTSNQVALYTWKVLSQYSTVGDTVSLPPGYLEAIEYNLALRLPGRIGNVASIAVSPQVVEIARTSKAAIKSLNTPAPIMDCDTALLSANRHVWDWRTGEYRRP